MCGFLVGGRGEEAREWGSVGKPGGALRRKPGASVNRAVLCAGMGERRYRRSAIPAQPSPQITDAPGFWRKGWARLGKKRPRPRKKPRPHDRGFLRYISFVDSSFSSTHSFSRMTGFLSTRPSRSAGTR